MEPYKEPYGDHCALYMGFPQKMGPRDGHFWTPPSEFHVSSGKENKLPLLASKSVNEREGRLPMEAAGRRRCDLLDKQH